jgi:hypothetical protein
METCKGTLKGAPQIHKIAVLGRKYAPKAVPPSVAGRDLSGMYRQGASPPPPPKESTSSKSGRGGKGVYVDVITG